MNDLSGGKGRRFRSTALVAVMVLGVGVGCGGGSAIHPDGGGAFDAAIPSCDGQCKIAFTSGADWTAFDDDPAIKQDALELGPAHPVCLNAGSPASCPDGALLYGYPGDAWTMVNLGIISGAIWIWAPDITSGDPADLQKVFFAHTFTLGSAPSGVISIFADDFAEVRVNGVPVDSVGSITSPSTAGFTLTNFDLSSHLKPGANTITIAAQNGPASFAGCPGACSYHDNPAGAVFGGSLMYH